MWSPTMYDKLYRFHERYLPARPVKTSLVNLITSARHLRESRLFRPTCRVRTVFILIYRELLVFTLHLSVYFCTNRFLVIVKSIQTTFVMSVVN